MLAFEASEDRMTKEIGGKIGVLRRPDFQLCLFAMVCGYGAAVLTGAVLQTFVAVWVLSFGIFVWRLLNRDIFSATPSNGPTRWTERAILLAGVLFHITLLVGLLVGGGRSSLWVVDSVSLHLPGIEKTMAFYRGEGSLAFDSIYGGQVQLTYLWVGAWFLVFGVQPAVSALALLLLRAVTWGLVFRIAKPLIGERLAAAAVLLAILTPTQIFYAMPLFKDPMVQLLTVAALWAVLRCYQDGHPKYAVVGMIAIAGLMLERFYIAPTLVVSLALAVLASPDKRWRRLRLGLATVGVLFGAVVFWKLFKRDINIAHLVDNLEWTRAGFQGGAEVDKKWNMELSYPLAFIKILFTPFFRANKFDFFTDLSALLTWGSFWGQAVTAAALWGIVCFWRRDRRGSKVETFILTVPLVLFLLMFAYLAPFSGRQRDSFFPVITIFAAVGIDSLLNRFRKPAK